jgi:hypothetical protein
VAYRVLPERFVARSFTYGLSNPRNAAGVAFNPSKLGFFCRFGC